MDQGVIRNWKGHYRSTLNDRIITELDADENRCALTVARSINLLDALYIAYKSWKRVKQQTIQNIFKKAGFRRDDPTDDCEDDSSVDHALHDVAVPSNMTTDEFVDFVSCDDDIVIAGEFDDEDLLQEVQQKKSRLDEDSKDGSGEDDDDDDEVGPMNRKERIQFLTLFRRFVQEQGFDHGKAISYRQVEGIVKEIATKELKQQTIDSFFIR